MRAVYYMPCPCPPGIVIKKSQKIYKCALVRGKKPMLQVEPAKKSPKAGRDAKAPDATFQLVTGRTIKQGIQLEAKMSIEYQQAAAVCEMAPDAMRRLKVADGATVLVRTAFGEVMVVARENPGNPDDVIFMPLGPWANAVVNPDTGGVGMPGFKGIAASVEPTGRKVQSIAELFAAYREGKG